MNINRKWTSFALETEVDTHGFARIAENHNRLRADLQQLRSFALEILEAWPDGGVEGDELQDIAEKHGLLKREIRYGRCGEICSCAEYVDENEFTAGIDCYRKTPLLLGEKE